MAEFIKSINLKGFFTPESLLLIAQIAAVVVVGYVVVRIIAGVVKRTLKKKVSPQMQMLVSKGIIYIGLFIIFLYALNMAGVKLAAILGAAGVIGIAVGIASQNSLSNIISGVFLISEKPFEIGDIVTLGDKTGIVMSVDLLSVKMRTFDNLFIRIPNEKIVNDVVTNITGFPIRRMDFDISVAYKEDLSRVREILFSVVKKNPLCLDEPEPLFLYKSFGDSGIEILFAVWFEKSQFLAVKNSVFEEIKKAFDEAGIEIPFPHTTVYTGAVTEPFPVQVVSPKGTSGRKTASKSNRF